MIASVISPPVPAVLPRAASEPAVGVSSGRRPLPLPPLVPVRTSRLVYGLAAVDDRGRVADRVVLRALGWSAGLRLTIAEAAGVLIVHTEPTGDHQVTGQGHLRLPATLRRRCALASGDRVLLAADPDQSRLTIYPPAALDHALARSVDSAGGDPV